MQAAAVPHPSSTLLLLRDRPGGLEVLMLERHADTFFSGALVFPGGRVDEADADPAVVERCRAAAGLDRAALAFRIAAIRECYEEAHILLARPIGEETLIGAAALGALEERLAAALGRPARFADLVAGGGVALATDLLVPYAHWVTPAPVPKRYDTHFFLAPAPADQAPLPDGREAVAVAWIAPAAAVAEADARRRRLIFATRMSLTRLGRSADAATALAAAAQAAVVEIHPEIYETPSGFRIRIAPDLGYDDCDMPVDDPARRR